MTGREAGTAPEELTDRDVCRYLGRKTIGKLVMVLIGDGLYRREDDGTWCLLPAAPDD